LSSDRLTASELMTSGKRAEAQPGADDRRAPPSDPGSPGEFLDPFANALLLAAKAARNEPAGDAKIMAAFKLGWLMGEILANRHAPPVASIILPSDPSAVYAAQGRQLKAHATDLELGDSEVATVLSDELSAGHASEKASGCEPELLTALLGAHVRFAKAYGLGRQLDSLTHETRLQPDRLRESDVAEMLALLDDLSTGLPPHAARGVANSIGDGGSKVSFRRMPTVC
jgi:hypothetical protein